jgi:formylglycine-generating enzyme
MKTISQAVSIGLGALALGAGVAAQAAAPVITNITMVGATPRFGVHSDLGITNQIQCCTNLSQTNWVVLTNLLVAQSPYWFVDVAAPPASQRFYRVAALAVSTPPPGGMVLIPAGSFTMGNCMAYGEGYSYELPLHTVNVSAFYMDTNLVSYTLWTNVYQWATNHGYSFTNAGSGKAASHPVQTVDWYDCVKWCNARSEKEGRVPCYYTNASQSQATIYRRGRFDLATNWVNWLVSGYRLPTEAEWEKAARGGASGHRFPWADADSIDLSRANYYAYPLSAGGPAYDVNPTAGYNPAWTNGGYPYTSPVGSFAANGYGLYDMAGNVWQWCWDWYDDAYYSSSPGVDPRGPAPGSLRVIRGGSWYGGAFGCRSALRYSILPASRYSDLGFRAVLPPGQP